MGSKFSKAVRSQVKAEASVTPAPTTSRHHGTDTNKRQDLAPQLPVCDSNNSPPPTFSLLSRDDLNLVSSTSPAMTSRQRRNSAPVPFGSETTALHDDTTRQQHLVSFEQFLAERQFPSIQNDDDEALTFERDILNIQYDHDEASTAQSAPVHPVPSVAEPAPQCLICCMDLPIDDDKVALKPCRSCNSAYCADCVKKMFTEACKDSTRMPPRCCVPINIQHAKPHLTKDEAALFRAKYEEWCTPDPLYCPVPVCSAFIPDRFLPQQVRTNKRRRVDSGVGTPISETFACPTCAASICTGCRQQAHSGSMCNINEFGLDADTAALLKSWGYKKCPKCGHGVKRMFGCNHMECRCGAHFCWVCLENINQCDGGCYDNDDEDEGDRTDIDSESDEDIPREPIDERTIPDDGAGAAAPERSPETAEPTETTTTPQFIPSRNLDGGGSNYWANTSFNFGDEPQNDGQDPIWTCHHSFELYTVAFATALTSHTSEMECVKCWSIIHPTISAPVTATNNKHKVAPAVPGRAAIFGVRGGRGRAQAQARGRGRGRGGYVPPRGLFRADATIGTAPHLSATLQPLYQSFPTRQVSPMEDVQFTQRNISTSPTAPRRASLASPHTLLHHTKQPKNSSVLDHTSKLNLAHECKYCYAVVCGSCKNIGVADQEGEDERRRNVVEEAATREREQQAREQEARSQRVREAEAREEARSERYGEAMRALFG
jgi:hypothetical protein